MRKGVVPFLAMVVLACSALAAWAVAPGPAVSLQESSGTKAGGPPGDGPHDLGLPWRLPAPDEPPGPVRFLAWGDAGHGNPTQHAVAEAAARVCASEGCGFVLQLGDNVYPHGVRNETDPQFVAKFEKPYANLSVPFYAALGNHDVALGPEAGAPRDNGDHMVRYAQRADRLSDKWTMPGRYYAFREGDVQVVVLDLTALARKASDPAAEAAQLAWLSTVWDEDAAWRVAVGHFPYVSNGRHGDAGRYDGVEGRGAAIAKVIEEHVCGKADLYLAGHDHHMEWLQQAPSCPGTELVVSGAASEPKPLRVGADAPAWWSVGDVAGFFWFEAQGDRLTGRAYGADGKVLFERTVERGEDGKGEDPSGRAAGPLSCSRPCG